MNTIPKILSLVLTTGFFNFLPKAQYISGNTINSASIKPVSSGNSVGSLMITNNIGGPSLSFGVVNTSTPYRQWGWLQTAYANNAGVYGQLALNPLGGNVAIGTINMQAKFNVYQSIGLGSAPKNSSLLSTISSSAGTSNNFQNNIWVVRNSTGSDWYPTRLHDGISIDGSF